MNPINLWRRFKVIFFIFCILLSLIVFKLSYHTIINHNYLMSGATALWSRSFPLAAPRGYIFDCNNNVLADNSPTVSLYAIPYQVKDKNTISEKLAQILNTSKDEILYRLNRNVSIVSFSKVGRKIDFKTAQKIVDEKMDGIYLVQDYKRVYPYKTSLSNLLGFVGSENIGFAGLENYYENYLQGKKGYLNYLMDAKGGNFENTDSNYENPVQGMSLKLTIDIKLQEILEREMENAFLRYTPEEVSAIMINPKNGEILAIGNRPTYDNNLYQNYDEAIYNRLLPVFNSFEPGSTFKAMTFAAAINENVIDIDKDYYYDKGYEYVDGFKIKSWKKGGHGLQTFLEVLQNSSNPGFVEISRRLGREKLYKYVYDFGFNQKTNIDIQGENKGLMFPFDKFNNLECATTSFGQGISVTAIQLVTAFSSLINGGKLYRPYVMKEIISSNLKETIYKNEPSVVRQVIKEETSKTMRRALESVVALGSGRKAYIDNYRVGGKTGTAQIQKNGVYEEGKYILSFLAGAPMNNPQIVAYFSMKNPQNCIQYGGTTVGPIMKRILEDSLLTLKIQKNYDGIERTYTWMDVEMVSVPNYIGQEYSKIKKLRNIKYEVYGSGNYIIDQAPRVGEMIETNGTIVLMLGDPFKN